MSVKLCLPADEKFSIAFDQNKFFSDDNLKIIRNKEKREKPKIGCGPDGCKTNLFFGFFFDGTRNNYILAEREKTHSNVARLYDCYPGLSVPGVLPVTSDWENDKSNYTHFFKAYIPGVGTEFKQVNDSGDGFDETAGAAAGYKGEERILWALLQAINNVHRYFMKTPLLSDKDIKSIILKIDLNKQARSKIVPPEWYERSMPNEKQAKKTRIEFEIILRELHAAVSQHWPDKKTGKPKKVDPGIVQKIYISIFGFSRGATQARAFTNWLMSLCRLDAHLCGKESGSMTLGGFEVAFDFLGLFDTVASIGAGNTLGNSFLGKIFDGHGSWADAEDSLRIPTNITCLHLVSAHELRRSFPLDSVSVKGVVTPNCMEIVFPGVHSDLGGGYAPREQGRGVDPNGDDMLTRIPLLTMYRAARLAGVPLKLELASAVVQQRFKVAPSTITDFNAYLAACTTKTGTLTAIMREQAQYQMQWRLARRAGSKMPLEATASFSRASTFDQNDLHSANCEFEQEIAAFKKWLSEKGKGFKPATQEPGFDNDHKDEWEEIARWWNNVPQLAPAMMRFFDEYVHDSRAWFKLIPGNADNEPQLVEDLKAWEAKRKAFEQFNARRSKEVAEQRHWLPPEARVMPSTPYKPVEDGLSPHQRNAAIEYARTGKLPRMITEGREPYEASKNTYYMWARAGYLRFRKIYSGWDSVLISQNETTASQEESVS
ncbi:hypothetical protein CNX70_13890 [Janthinobacterium svalbardensis]|uniref:T6SS Phospholipase effector Tle1-like catalytic domain-containing protein n=1 Tax=Janthinobacterium svalbardensis TaxID=368607 RepID=A0A290WW83_9BURK|nr:DUF2235 domain-containing protein [Janthinobacterium svalbardensis]ATD61134.1 hypothetical protein CNX70_13890 [Janthinobacterium svalbardensis]